MENSTNLFRQGTTNIQMSYYESKPKNQALSQRTLAKLEEFQPYAQSTKSLRDKLAVVSIFMQYWGRNIVSRQYAAKVAVQLLNDLGITFNREVIFEDIEHFATALVSREIMSDYNKFTLLTQPYESLVQDTLHQFSVRLDLV